MLNYIEINKRCYDRLAKEYESRRKKYKISNRKVVMGFINYLKRGFEKIRILELGQGSGLDLISFEKEGFHTTAIDISKEMIKVSKKVAPKTKYICENFLKYDFDKHKYEGVFAKAFIQLFPKKDAVKVLKKMKSLLVNGGILFIGTTVHKLQKEGFFIKEDFDNKVKRYRKEWVEKELVSEVKKVGLNILDKKYNYDVLNKNKKWVSIIASR